MAKRIGRYEIQVELGRGGFGQVFRALDPTMGSMVAIKTLVAGNEPDLPIRFRNEAAAARKLQHRNIVTVYDFGEENGVPYIVMELLEGEDLQQVLARRRPLTALQKIRIMSQVAEGLHYAHQHGVVHRDVKPANIMLLSDDSVKIMDFGIALVTQATGQRLTRQGTTLGTFRYMAPEQFEGTASDVQSDIFSYGLVYYELLTGTYPFDAAEPAGVMYKIMRAQARPIREVCSDCPNGLETVVSRLLEKERELRYQSLEDVQFDIQPILLDLQKTHAAELLVRSKDLAARDQVDAAQALVREILRLDPANTSARELREMLHEQAQQNAVRARVEGLLKTGREKMAQQDYSGAIASFESALHVDRSNPGIQTLMQQARDAMEQVQRARLLLDEAQRALDLRNLTGAYKNATEALQLDPGNSKASVLLETVLREMAVRERERRSQEAISRAKGLLMLQAFDDAISLLLALQPDYPESREISELLTRIRLDKSVHERRQRLMAGIAAAKDLLRNKRLADAIQLLEQLAREFPETAEVRDLLTYAREELAAQQRAEAVKRATEEARAQLDAKEFDRAIETLNKALQLFPGEDSLSYLLQTANSAKASWDRRWALTETLQFGQKLVVEQRYEEAVRRIDGFVSAHGSDPALTDLRKRAQAEWEHQNRIEAMGKLMGEARDLLAKGRPGSATRILQGATAQYPEEPELAALLQVAQTKVLEQQRAEAIDLAVNEAKELTKRLQFDRAEQMIQEALKRYPEDADLTRCLETTRRARFIYQQEQEKQEALQRGIQLHHEGRFADAAGVVASALRAHPNNSDLLALKARIDADWEQRSKAVQRVSDQARALMGQHLLEQAISLLEENLRRFSGEPELTLLLTQVEHQLRARREAEEAQRRERAAQPAQPPPEVPRQPALSPVETLLRRHWWRVALATAAFTILGASIAAVYRWTHPRVSVKPLVAAAPAKTERAPNPIVPEPIKEPATQIPAPVEEPLYDPATEVSITAVVTNVREVPRGNPLSGVHLSLRLKSQAIDAHLGPADFVRQFKIHFAKGDKVKVTGSRVKNADGTGVILVREVSRGQAILSCRGAKGEPSWISGNLATHVVPQPKLGPSDHVSAQLQPPTPPRQSDTVKTVTVAPPSSEHIASATTGQEPGSGKTLPKPAEPPPTPTAPSGAGLQGNQEQVGAKEEREWSALNKDDRRALETFDKEHPTGNHHAEIVDRLRQLTPPQPPVTVTESVSKLKETRPNSDAEAGLLNARGVSAKDRKDYSEAISDFSQAIKLKPDQALYYFNRGGTYFELGRWNEALDDLEKSLTLNPPELKATKWRNEARENLAAGVTKLSSGDPQPSCTQGVLPLYTREANKAGVRPAAIILRFVVDERGRPKLFRVDKPIGYGLDEAAIEVVKTWSCWPGKKDGKRVATEVRKEVPFRFH
jgi:TonB family protein